MTQTLTARQTQQRAALIDTFERFSKTGKLAEVELLLKAGAPLNAPDKEGTTPLMFAAAVPPMDSWT